MNLEQAVQQHAKGSRVWVFLQEDAEGEGWYSGEVVDIMGGQLVVKSASGHTGTYKPEECPLQNPSSLRGVEVRTCWPDRTNAAHSKMRAVLQPVLVRRLPGGSGHQHSALWPDGPPEGCAAVAAASGHQDNLVLAAVMGCRQCVRNCML